MKRNRYLTGIKCSTEFQEEKRKKEEMQVKMQIRKYEARMLELQREETLYLIELERRVMLRKEEENQEKEELWELAQFEKEK
ncbi:hypothetical protein NPIL_46751 [Nephila pilipes]|uniref:Uncharacterized protein n=1 Tax=Nephila pilipes TaxID=299642 RepID=A0A8X6PJ73_NEPPI|nr:hypothetical protein NPIL_46751 [Nephila pilipes]